MKKSKIKQAKIILNNFLDKIKQSNKEQSSKQNKKIFNKVIYNKFGYPIIDEED